MTDPTCKGSIYLGTGCLTCSKCVKDLETMKSEEFKRGDAYMSIKRYKEKKRELELCIAEAVEKLISDFQEETQTHITGISLYIISNTEIGMQSFGLVSECNVKVEI